MKTYIFGYGSLINLESISKTIGREVYSENIEPVKLLHHRRIWNLKESIFSEVLKKDIIGIFLNIEPSQGQWINGVLFEVSQTELFNLSERERNYRCIEISRDIIPYADFESNGNLIFVYLADDLNHLQNKPAPNYFVMNKYVEIVERGCFRIGNFFLDDYRKTTSDISFKKLDGMYRFN